MVEVFTKCCTTKEMCVNEIIKVPPHFIIECFNSPPLGKIEIHLTSEPYLCVSAYEQVNKDLD